MSQNLRKRQRQRRKFQVKGVEKMKLKDGRKVKLKWREILHPRQIWGLYFGKIKDDYLYVSDEVGTVVMWIAYIISFPILLIFSILYFPIDVIRFKRTVKNAPDELIKKEVLWTVEKEEENNNGQNHNT